MAGALFLTHPIGQFSGSEITFLYPGMRRGLRGEWREGKLVTAKGVQVQGFFLIIFLFEEVG